MMQKLKQLLKKTLNKLNTQLEKSSSFDKLFSKFQPVISVISLRFNTLSSREKVLITGLIVGFLSYGFYEWGIMSQINHKKSLNFIIEEKSKKIAQISTQVRALDPGSLPTSNKYKKHIQKLNKSQGKTSESSLIRDLILTSYTHQVSIDKFTYSNTQALPQTNFKHIQFDVLLSGHYSNLVEFIYELQKLPSLYKIQTLSMTKSSVDQTLNMAFKINFYFL